MYFIDQFPELIWQNVRVEYSFKVGTLIMRMTKWKCKFWRVNWRLVKRINRPVTPRGILQFTIATLYHRFRFVFTGREITTYRVFQARSITSKVHSCFNTSPKENINQLDGFMQKGTFCGSWNDGGVYDLEGNFIAFCKK